MLKKDLVYKLLINKDYDQILSLFDNNKQIMKYLAMTLYNPDGDLKWRAIEAIGYLTKERADHIPDYFRDLARRYIWAMNEESANVSWSAPEVIGVVIASRPDLYGDLATVMISGAIDEPIFQKGMLWAMKEIGQVNKSLIQGFIPQISEFLLKEDKELKELAEQVIRCFESR